MKKLVLLSTLIFGLLPVMAARKPALRVDDCLPAGNIIVERISSDTVYVKPDLRDTKGKWFYWAMRVRGAQGRTLVFQFNGKWVGARGPLITTDKGKSYRYGGGKAAKSFKYTFGPDEKEVWFYECYPYLPADWNAFLSGLDKKMYTTGILCRSLGGKKVPRATFGRLDGQAKHQVVITARHHCSESVASFVMEGIAQACCAQDETGRWLRENVELNFVPFVDYDGVIRGDQGKNRAPHDHNRDYSEFLYNETKAVAALYAEKRPVAVIDLHNPYISGKGNEAVECPMLNPEIVQDLASEERFTALMEQYAEGLPYKGEDNVQFGTSWNKNKNYSAGLSCRNWAMLNLQGLHLCRCFEIPFANACGTEVNPESARAFGRSIAKTLVEWFPTIQ